MAWDATTPATNGPVVSAPLRGNFAALDTQVMAPLIAAAPDLVLKVGASDTLGTVAAGTNGQVLTLVSGAPAWTTPAFVSPMTAVGDLITGTTAGAPQRLAIGTTGHVLTATGGVPAWQALPVTQNPSLTGPLTLTHATDAVVSLIGSGTGGRTWIFTSASSGSAYGANAGSLTLYDVAASRRLLSAESDGSLGLWIFSVGFRYLNAGATDSGGSGFRTLRVPN